MKPSATLSLLQELYRERLALFDRHIKGAQAIADYEFNNTYQYVVGREEHHLQHDGDLLHLSSFIDSRGVRAPT